ncbi:SKP1-like protein 1A [Rhynchospora pubera]|uniref:SKP1-like protein n=1 Tax=Rhynchospora pubera TaxID=906938 RepID=A0AAV8FP25_9POAL|nr:SKP1-like protein 1A [Rhynchospora pubera]
MITLISSDKRKFYVLEEVANQSLAIRDVIENKRGHRRADRIIWVTDINSRILEKVILYWLKHFVVPEERGGHPSKSHKKAEKLKKWESEFFDTDIDTLNDLILAADSLDIPSLFDGACEKVADILKNRSAEEVAEISKIENELTHEEEEEIRSENAWAYA